MQLINISLTGTTKSCLTNIKFRHDLLKHANFLSSQASSWPCFSLAFSRVPLWPVAILSASSMASQRICSLRHACRSMVFSATCLVTASRVPSRPGPISPTLSRSLTATASIATAQLDKTCYDGSQPQVLNRLDGAFCDR